MTVITQAFEMAATVRAGVLGLPDHPTVVIGHPIASRTTSEVVKMAAAAAERVVAGMLRAGGS